jgi:putative peptidoglycan lipid II flippase
MLKSSGAMAAATMTSRLLGMVRESVYASFMGNSMVASAFTLAFQVPNLFRRLLGEGALTAAFIPLFKQKERENEKEMWRAANAIISGVTIACGAITLLALITITIALNTMVLEEHTRLVLRLMRWMFPYVILVCLAAVYIGMANSRGHFFIPSLGAVLLNVIMISSVIWLAPHMGIAKDQQIFGLAIGVLLAGLAQAVFQLPTLHKEGYRLKWESPWQDPTVREVVRKMIPGSIGVAAFQINVLLTQTFSFWFEPTIVSTFNYAVRLMELPQGLFGISLATYLLPTLSGLAADKKFPEFRSTLSTGLSHLALANLFAAAISFSLAEPIVRLVFERGAFGPSATQRVTLSLMCLAPGLLMFSMNNILARAFFALQDIRTPMKISVFCLGINLVFAFFLVQRLGEAGLGIANTASALINTGLLTYALKRKLKTLDSAKFVRTLTVLIPAALVAGAIAWFGGHWCQAQWGIRAFTPKLVTVFLPAALAGLAYCTIAFALKVESVREMASLVTRKFKRS